MLQLKKVYKAQFSFMFLTFKYFFGTIIAEILQLQNKVDFLACLIRMDFFWKLYKLYKLYTKCKRFFIE